MPADEHVLAVVRAWVQKAENDLNAALLILQAGEKGPADMAAFHAQQCAEKYLKALLSLQGIEFPNSHDIGQLILLLGQTAAFDLPAPEQRRLTSYATVARYPGAYEPVTVYEARRAADMALQIRERVRKLLPAPLLT